MYLACGDIEVYTCQHYYWECSPGFRACLFQRLSFTEHHITENPTLFTGNKKNKLHHTVTVSAHVIDTKSMAFGFVSLNQVLNFFIIILIRILSLMLNMGNKPNAMNRHITARQLSTGTNTQTFQWQQKHCRMC